MIAPTFESLATKYSKPKKIAFCKVDVDAHQDVAQQYGVSAMPTFLILRNGAVIDTIRGANPPALSAAVEKAVKLAGPGVAAGPSFSSAGHRLGGAPVGPAPGGRSLGRSMNWNLGGLIGAIISFIGLYLATLFSVSAKSPLLDFACGTWLIDCLQFDPYKAAENWQNNKRNAPQAKSAAGGSGAKTAARPGFKTLADLGS